ncbi:MAG TPA: PepSY-associated TM helix domain-containing protein [Rudaea sp.]|nr:PepSY-associated TM helix domain-containing protein [Rudaea sp.]
MIRQLHLWIGAWGALAAILFGFTGFVQNHRALLKLPQGEATELTNIEVPVPDAVRATPDTMRAWLVDVQHVDIDNQRVQRSAPMQFNGQTIDPPARWTFTGGNARVVTQVEYRQGDAALTLRTTRQSPLATLLRLHKGVGGGIAWILLTDSFALAMIALGLSGLVLWARGRNTRQMAFSTVGAALVIIALVGAAAVA